VFTGVRAFRGEAVLHLHSSFLLLLRRLRRFHHIHIQRIEECVYSDFHEYLESVRGNVIEPISNFLP